MDRKKKEIEKHILTRFISNPKLKLNVVGIEDSETPDFIIKTLKKKLSIEITRLFDPGIKEIESMQSKIVNQAKELFNNKFDSLLRVFVTFSNQPIQCKQLELMKYSEELFNIIAGVYNHVYQFDFTLKTENQDILGKHYESIYIDNQMNFENWQTFGAYLVPYIGINQVNVVINEKEIKLLKYREDFVENWLLICAHLGNKSSAFRFEQLKDLRLDTKFDKIYLYQYMKDEFMLLK